MDSEVLIATFPRLYHMAEHDSWPSIQKHGLLSTSALLDLFEVSGEPREKLEAAHRPNSVAIHHPRHGRAVIRDQKPMSDGGLKRCLNGVTPREWYVILNAKVFFWPHEERLKTLLGAQAYRNDRHCVLTVDSRKLVERHSERILLSPMNSGATKPMPHPRSRETFLPIAAYPFDQWLEKRKQRHKAVAEIAVTHSVPDIAQIVVEVAIWQGGRVLQRLFPA
ncbi:MAG: hypothetical protein KIS67_01830 [Verrucomicrobiae bacterium]|nr:hypothetical protein [Verrucomicrobiae bacterium]